MKVPLISSKMQPGVGWRVDENGQVSVCTATKGHREVNSLRKVQRQEGKRQMSERVDFYPETVAGNKQG